MIEMVIGMETRLFLSVFVWLRLAIGSLFLNSCILSHSLQYDSPWWE